MLPYAFIDRNSVLFLLVFAGVQRLHFERRERRRHLPVLGLLFPHGGQLGQHGCCCECR
jgi:hypothetical protein